MATRLQAIFCNVRVKTTMKLSPGMRKRDERGRRWNHALFFVAVGVFSLGCASLSTIVPLATRSYHVYPDDDIQAVLDAAASDSKNKRILVHAGTYRPREYGQAFVRFNRQHDGITMEAVGEVILTAANPDIAEEERGGFPAVVNHVVYFGDGITRNTALRGFKITGARDFVTGMNDIEPGPLYGDLRKGLIFYTDGGGIKIFGRSYPTIENVEVYDNYSSPCGGGVSIEHQGYNEDSVLLRNCIFRNNSCPLTGSAVDLLRGSAAIIENCLFVDNLSNCPLDDRSEEVGKWRPVYGAGALTVFPTSRVIVRRSTFTGNRNGVDDAGQGNLYEDSIFWMNNAAGGWPPGGRYEVGIDDAAGVNGCYIRGVKDDLKGTIDPAKNVLDCRDPQFDGLFRPRARGFENIGYRPSK